MINALIKISLGLSIGRNLFRGLGWARVVDLVFELNYIKFCTNDFYLFLGGGRTPFGNFDDFT